MIPIPQITIELPEMMVRADRLHNKYVRESLKEELELHHFKRIPDHFEQSAHSKYKYAPRSPKYVASKIRRYGNRADLVKSGKTRDHMKANYKITISGSATGKNIQGNLKMNFPFTGGSGRFKKPGSRQAITITQMIKEMQAITEQEAKQIARGMGQRYTSKVNATSKRMRVGPFFNVGFEDSSPNL